MNNHGLKLSVRMARACFAVAGLICGIHSGSAALVIVDDFETNEGHFTANPNTGSGTSQGFVKVDANTNADRVTTDFYDGLASQQIRLDDDPNVGGIPTNPAESWRLRHLSGGGTPASNLSLGVVPGGTSYVGYWIKTNSVGFQAGISIDDGPALEIGRWQNVTADGQWHLYEWQFQDANDWDAFAGTGPNGIIDNASVTIDSLFFRGGVGFGTGADFDVTFLVDRVAYNPDGSTVPEPASMTLLGLAGMAIIPRRRRALS